MLNKKEIEKVKNNRIPKELESFYGIEREDINSLIAFKESLFEKIAKENIKLKKQVEQLETEKQKLIDKLEKDINIFLTENDDKEIIDIKFTSDNSALILYNEEDKQ